MTEESIIRVTEATYELLQKAHLRAQKELNEFNQLHGENTDGPRDSAERSADYNAENNLKLEAEKAEKLLLSCLTIQGPVDTETIKIGHLVSIKRNGHVCAAFKIDGVAVLGNGPICSIATILGKNY